MDISNKKVLVTGADGFIGGHLAEALVSQGCQVKAFCCYNAFNSYGWLEELASGDKKNLDCVLGDIRDAECVEKAVEGVDVIVHLAALVGIPYSYQAAESYIDTNIKGALNILRAARTHNTSKVLVTSSAGSVTI